VVVRLAEQISTFDAEIADVDAQITELFRQHDSADVLLTMPGFGPVLAATFLANIGGNLDGFDSVDRLASVAGMAPVPRDSGRISGNLHRPRRRSSGPGFRINTGPQVQLIRGTDPNPSPRFGEHRREAVLMNGREFT
jgi:hypothetical protein